MYHFITGYTAKVVGTELVIKEPEPTFSACFGEAFLAYHPSRYAELLAEKIRKHQCTVWLVNTGWTGGQYGDGRRMELDITRQILDQIHEGNLKAVETTQMDIFGLHVPNIVSGISQDLLHPVNTWAIKEDYIDTMVGLAKKFEKNFEKYAKGSSDKIFNAGPRVS
jgi:phosphoenolpyruvate carboxykinase (ATP)